LHSKSGGDEHYFFPKGRERQKDASLRKKETKKCFLKEKKERKRWCDK